MRRRIRTDSLVVDGEPLDLGGQFVGPGQDRAYALAAELGIAVHRTHTTGLHLAESSTGAVSRFRGLVPGLNPIAMLDFAQAEARFERLARTVDITAPWDTANAEALDDRTMADWIRHTLRTSSGRQLFTLAVRLLWACETAELSLLHALFYARSAGGLRFVMSTEGGAQQDRLGTARALSVRLAERLGGRIVLGAPVRHVAQDPSGVTVTADSGRAWRAEQVVVALPPTFAGRIAYDPPLPAIRDSLTQRLGMGSAVKIMIVYPRPFWRASGLSGHALSLRGPLAAIADSSPPDARRGVLTSVLEAATARLLSVETPERRRALVLTQLTKLFGVQAGEPSAFVERDWNAEEFTRGAYAALYPPGAWTQFGPAARRPVGRIHWAGSETATRSFGYIDGAIRSGKAAALNFLGVAPRSGRTLCSGGATL